MSTNLKISHWYKWGLVVKAGVTHIRRYRKVAGKIEWEFYPKDKFRDYTPDEIKTLLNRLNSSRLIEEQQAAARYDFDYSYINRKSIEGFEASLSNKIEAKDYIVNIMSMLNDFTFKFFIRTLKVPDPNHWLRYEDKFASFLMKEKKSVSYLKRIIQVTNRFLKYLHRTNPDEVRLIILDPLSKMKLQSLKAKNSIDREKYITSDQYKKILKEVDDKTILPAIEIAYHFGLRIAEVLGLEVDDVFEDCLDVKRQLIKLTPIKYTGPLKNKIKRSVPYWFASPEDVYNWIESLPQIHHDTLSDRFKAQMDRLNLPFQFHDLRRTFITNALRKYNSRDVQLSAGHSDLRTTMLYAQDDRQLQRKRFKPNKIKLVD